MNMVNMEPMGDDKERIAHDESFLAVKPNITSSASLILPVVDSFIYCEQCKLKYEGICPEHGPLIYIDKAEMNMVNMEPMGDDKERIAHDESFLAVKPNITSSASLILPVEDSFIYCEQCKLKYEGICPEHGPLIYIDKAEMNMMKMEPMGDDKERIAHDESFLAVKPNITSSASLILPVEDSFIYCEQCKLKYEGICPEHGPLIYIDKAEIYHDHDCTRDFGTDIRAIRNMDTTKPGMEKVEHSGLTEESEEDSPNSADENMTNTLAAQDSSGSKNRSKWKPSKTQIKHITPKDGNCDISKYGTPNMEDLFNDDAHGIYKGKKSQMQASSSQPLTPSSVASRPTVISRTSKRVRKRPHAPVGPTSSLRRPTSRRPSNYSCGICGKMFFAPNRYNSHMQGHSRGKSFCCKTCGKFFSSQDKLNYHFPVHNTDKKASFTCRTCGKICVNWRAYLYHLKAKHTESGGKQFACNICGHQFLAVLRLRKHMVRHATGKHHCCNICGKLFEARKELDIHVLVHNLTSKHGQNLQCSDCGRHYSKWMEFRQHMKTHEVEGVQYPCGECDMVFSTQYEKEKHKRQHKLVRKQV